MQLITDLLNGDFMPHGHCLLWRPDLLSLHAGGDLLTLVAYFAIPPAMLVFRNKRPDMAYDRLLLLFAAFIFLCGISHLMGLVNIWQGFYVIEGLAKLATGLVSLLTCVLVWRLLPTALSVPTTEAMITNHSVMRETEQQVRAARAELARLEKEIAQKLETLKKPMPDR